MSEQSDERGGPERATPLEYQTPPPPPPSITPGGVAGAVRGFICGAFLMAFLGGPMVVIEPRLAVTSPSGPPVPVRAPKAGLGAFLLIVLIAAVGGAVALRRSRPRSTFYLGVLIGVGVMALCEGLCFVAQP